MRLRRVGASHWWHDAGLAALALVVDLALWGGDGTLRTGGSVPFVAVLAIAVPVFASLALRRRWPRSVYAVAWVYSVACAVAIPLYEPFTALLIALYQISRHLPVRRGLPFLLATSVPWAVNSANAIALTHAGPAVSIGVVASWAAMTAIVWVAGRFGYRAAEMASLREQNQAAQAALAVQDERLRLARELHDSVANSVTAVILQAAGARQAASPATEPTVHEALEAIEASATQAMRELRRLLGLLHETHDFEAALESGTSLRDLPRLLDQTRACAVSVSVTEDGRPTPLDPSIDHAAYRVLQESLGNVVKHGGRGAAADVRLSWAPGSLLISVRSTPGLPDLSAPVDGHAALPESVEPGGSGLPGLGHRVAAVGGRLEAGASGTDFLVAAELPCARPMTSV